MSTQTYTQEQIQNSVDKKQNVIDRIFDDFSPVIDLTARLGLAAMFLLAGINKVQYYDGNVAYMATAGLPEFLMPLVIALEIGAAIALIVGYQTRLAAFALAGFTILAALLFHFDLNDQMQSILFFKNIAVAGGLLLLVAKGPGKISLDARH